MDSASDVIALIAWRGVGQPFRHLPVLGVAAGDGDLDHNLAWLSLGDGRVNDLDLGACVDDGFLHLDVGVGMTKVLEVLNGLAKGEQQGEV